MTNDPQPEAVATPRKIARAERRQWIRYPSSLAVQIRPFGARDDRTWLGKLQDVSFVGIGLISELPVEPGAVLEMRPQSRAWTAALKLTVRVRKAVELPEGGWLLGCTLVRQLTDQELEGLLS
jgi:hypothetical protein